MVQFPHSTRVTAPSTTSRCQRLLSSSSNPHHTPLHPIHSCSSNIAQSNVIGCTLILTRHLRVWNRQRVLYLVRPHSNQMNYRTNMMLRNASQMIVTYGSPRQLSVSFLFRTSGNITVKLARLWITLEYYLVYANWPMWILSCIDIYLLLFAFSWKNLKKKIPKAGTIWWRCSW